MSYGPFEPGRLLGVVDDGSLGRRQRNRQRPAPSVDDLGSIIHPGNLLEVFGRQRATAGLGPGLDGLRYDDLSVTEAGEAFRRLSRMIANRAYRPQAAREVAIPKADGGHRTLRVRSILDRTIARAVVDVLTPAVEVVLLDGVMGFRPGRGIWTLLARLLRWIHEGRTVVAQSDIRGAFDHVPIHDALTAYCRLIQNEDLLWLIDTLLRGCEGGARTIGIDQGCPLSPMTLNVILGDAVDRPLDRAAQDGAPLWLRYVDNITLACQSVTEGRSAISKLGTYLLEHSMTTKPGSESVVDLRRQGARTQIVGFGIHGTATEVRLPIRAYEDLREGLERCHNSADPDRVALETVAGWIESAGPALGEDRLDETIGNVRHTLRETGFREQVPADGIRQRAQEAHSRWQGIRRSERSGNPPIP